MSTFDDFWTVFPRRVAKLDAQKAWAKAVKIATPEIIIDGARRYAMQRNGQDQQFTKYPAGWLRAGGWMDEAPAPAVNAIQARKERLAQRINDEHGIGRQGSSDPETAGWLFGPESNGRLH